MENESLESSHTDSRSKMQTSSSNSTLQHARNSKGSTFQLNSNSSKSQLNDELAGTSIVFDYYRRQQIGSQMQNSDMQEKEVKLKSDTFEKRKQDKQISFDMLLLGENVLPQQQNVLSSEEDSVEEEVYEEVEEEEPEEEHTLELNQPQVEDTSKKNLEMLCVDPNTMIHYRLSMTSNNYFIIEPQIKMIDELESKDRLNRDFEEQIIDKHSQDLENEIKEKIKKHRNIIRRLTKLDDFIWLFNRGEVDQYRRRKLPQYLIAREVSDYPSYVFQSELSKAFNSISHILLRVNLMEYSKILMNSTKNTSDHFVEIKESLVTSSKEVIKNVLHAVKKKFKIPIIPLNKDSMLILKVDGYREYFKGNYQLLAYERVRICLRSKKNKLNLILTEIPQVHIDKHFPPLFKMEENEPFNFKYLNSR